MNATFALRTILPPLATTAMLPAYIDVSAVWVMPKPSVMEDELVSVPREPGVLNLTSWFGKTREKLSRNVTVSVLAALPLLARPVSGTAKKEEATASAGPRVKLALAVAVKGPAVKVMFWICTTGVDTELTKEPEASVVPVAGVTVVLVPVTVTDVARPGTGFA